MKRLKYLKYTLIFFFFQKMVFNFKIFYSDVTVSATLAFARQFMTLWIANWNNLKKEFVRKEK